MKFLVGFVDKNAKLKKILKSSSFITKASGKNVSKISFTSQFTDIQI